MQATTTAAPAVQRRGYLPGFLGSLGGAVALGGLGTLAGYAVGDAYADAHPTPGYLGGLADGLAAIGWAIFCGMIGAFLGAVGGCWLALRALKTAEAGRTAAILAGLLPAAYFLLLGLDQLIRAEYLGFGFFGLPFLARRLALRSSE